MTTHLSMLYLMLLMLVASTRAQHASLQVESSGGCVASVNKELYSPNSTIYLKCEELKCSKEGWIPTNEQDPDCELPFFAAVAKGEISNVKEFLEKGMSPNTKNKKGASIALKAIQNGHLEILKTLLENGTDPQAPTALSLEESTLVLYAAAHASIEVIDVLLQHGADINNHVYGSTPLRNAIKRKDIRIIQYLMDHNVDVNEVNIFQDATVLIGGVSSGNKDIITLLISNGAAVNDIAINGITALQTAIELGNNEIVKLLLDNDADSNTIIHHLHGGRVLSDAIAHNHLDIAQTLLEYGADPNDAPHGGETALSAAFKKKNSNNLIDKLLEKGADINVTDTDGNSVLILAASRNHTTLFTTLLENGVNPNIINDKGDTALILAARDGNLYIVRTLLENGANTSITNRKGDSALTLAASINHTKIVTTLLENGANPNTINDNGDSALSLAASRNHTKIVTTLLENGANPNISKGEVPLIEAVLKGSIDIVKILLDNNANVDASDRWGKTSLGIASRSGYHDIVETLIHHGANVDMKSRRQYDLGYTALISAAERNYSNIVTTLLENGANTDLQTFYDKETALISAAERNYSYIVKKLLESGANTDIQDKYDYTALISAASKNNLDIVKTLLENGANPNFATNVGYTALIHAAKGGNLDMVKTLLENGANTSNTTAWGESALTHATIRNHAQIVTILLENGANPNIINVDGISLIEHAIDANKAGAVEALLTHGVDPNQKTKNGISLIEHAINENQAGAVEALLIHGVDPNQNTRTAPFAGPFNNIWNSDECRYIGRHDRQSLSGCQLRCIQTPDCTAINFKEDDCVLRACGWPVPQPQWNYPPYQGYQIGKDTSQPQSASEDSKEGLVRVGKVPKQCPDDTFKVDKECFFIPNEGFKTWRDAQEICRSQGGFLAEPNSIIHLQKALTNITSGFNFWLGGVNLKNDRNWRWSSDKSMIEETQTLSVKEEEDFCLLVMRGEHLPLFRAKCSHYHLFVCEKN